jgi:hypothetical protein
MRAYFINIGSNSSVSLVVARTFAIAVAKQYISVAKIYRLYSAVVTVSLYNSLRVRSPYRMLRLLKDAKILRCRGALWCRRGGNTLVFATAYKLLSILLLIALLELKLLLVSNP